MSINILREMSEIFPGGFFSHQVRIATVQTLQQHPTGYGTYPSAGHQSAAHHGTTSSLPRSAPGTLGWPKSGSSPSPSPSFSSSSPPSSLQQIQQRISIPPNSGQGNQECFSSLTAPKRV